MSYLISGKFDWAALFYGFCNHTTKGLQNATSDLIQEFGNDIKDLRVEFAEQRKVELERAHRRAETILKNFSESMELSKKAEADRLTPELYEDCLSRVDELKTRAGHITRHGEQRAFFHQASETEKKIMGMMEKAQKQVGFEKMVEAALQALGNLGFRVNVEYQSRETVSVLGQSNGKQVRVDVDQEGKYEADFFDGYTHPQHMDCVHDLKSFLEKIQAMGVEVEVYQTTPVQPTGGLSNVKKQNAQRPRKSPKAIARTR